MAGIVTQLVFCEELTKISEEFGRTINYAKLHKMPASYIVGCFQETNDKLLTLIDVHSGGIYPAPKRINAPSKNTSEGERELRKIS